MAYPTLMPSLPVSHGLQLASKGILGSTVGTVSKGYIISIFTTIRDAGGGGRRTPSGKKLKKDQKCILITVEAYGKLYTKEECIPMDRNVKIKDVEVIDNGEEIISIQVLGIK